MHFPLLRILRHALLLVLIPVAAGCGQNNTVNITVRVVAPSLTPTLDSVFVAGNSRVLGDWNPGAVPMTARSDSVHVFSWKVARGETVELKVTRGSWHRQAIFEKGEIPQNVRFTAVRDTVIELRPVTWADLDSEGRPLSGISGTARYHRNLRGDGLRYDRDVVVWLPPSYEQDRSRRYPVLYMHDGQNVFDPGTSFLGFDWRVDEVADSLIRIGKIREIIVVAVSNTQDRVAEYSDTEKGRAYARFVATTLKTLIDSTYRTQPDPGNTAVMGSSMGGLISFLFVWWHPDVFSGAGCLSGAFIGEYGGILKAVEQDRGPRKKIRVYLDCGTQELEARLRPGYEMMVKLLEKRGYRKGNDLEYFLDEGAAHNEQAWAHRVWRPLVFLFGN